MTENEFTYWAFLSYSPQDNGGPRPDAPAGSHLSWGDWLHDVLKTFSIPAEFVGQINARGEIIPERIEPIFQAAEESPGNAELSETTRQALAQSHCLVVICSPRSAQSRPVNEAVRYFKQLGRGNRILPLVIAGEPNATDGHKPGRSPADECFVPALRHPVAPDGTLDLSRRDRGPLFADARQGDDKREILATDHSQADTELEAAKIRLIAGLLGVGFNGLWGREQIRRYTAAQIQVREARQQIQEVQNQARASQGQVLEAQHQLEAARQQVRAAERQALESQNLPPDVKSQLQEAQNQVQEAQHQARTAHRQAEEARQQASAAQSQVQAIENQARQAQSQTDEARHQARAAESQVLQAQQQARDAQSRVQELLDQIQAAKNTGPEIPSPTLAAPSQVLEAQNQARAAQGEIQAAQQQAQEANIRAQEAQAQLQVAPAQVREAEQQVRAAQPSILEIQTQLQEAQNQARAAQAKVQEIQSQTRAAQSQIQQAQTQALEAQNQARAVQAQVQEIQNKARVARRLTKVFALLAVLTLLAASLVTSLVWRQRQVARPALAQAASAAAQATDLAAGPMNAEQIRPALQKLAGAGPEWNRLRLLDDLATRIPPAEIPEALTASAILLADPPRGYFQGQLLERWLQADLAGAFGWVCSLTNAAARERALEKIIPALAADNPTNTLARLNELQPAPGERSYTLFFQRWAAQDPIQAIEQRQSIPGQDAGDTLLGTILAVWGEQQPEAALDWVKSQPDGTWRNALIVGLFTNWAAKNLAAATTACQQLPDGVAKEKAWESVLGRRITTDPAAAADDVKNLPAGDFRQKAMVELGQHWADTDPPAALAWAQSLGSGAELVAALNQIVTRWARQDPAAASQFAEQHPELSGAALGGIATAWFQRDFNATTNWIARLPEGEKKNAAQLALGEPWAQNDPKGMAAYALGLPIGEVQTQFLTAACRQLARGDLPGTVEVLQPLADAALRLRLLEQAARSCDLPHLDPAAKQIAALPAGDDQQAAIKGLLSNWTAADPEAAINWLGSFPETNAQPEKMQSVLQSWAQTEPAAAAQWLAKLPPGTAREGMVSAFLAGAAVKYPEFAGQWTQSVTDATQRQMYQLQVARQWLKTDSAAAIKWVDTLDLPEALKPPLPAPLP